MGASPPNSLTTRDPVSDFRRQTRRVLPLCLVASAMLHSGVLALFSGMTIDRVSPPVPALDVRLLAAAPPAVVPVAAAQLTAGRRSAQETAAATWAPERRPQPKKAPMAARPAAEGMPHISAVATEPASEVPAAGDGARAASAPTVAATGSGSATPRKAAYLHNPPPAYPLSARRNGEEGTVTLRVLVARDGAPASIVVQRSSGHARLDRSALEAVKAWRFVPAREHGEAVETWMLVPIVFRLEGTS